MLCAWDVDWYVNLLHNKRFLVVISVIDSGKIEDIVLIILIFMSRIIRTI